MKKGMKKIVTLWMLLVLFTAMAVPVSAAQNTDTTEAAVTQQVQESSDDAKGDKAMAAAIVVGLAATAGAIGMGWAIAKSAEGISRQPEAEGKIRTTLMLGLVFIETAIIYALVIAILIIFVL